MGLCQCNMGAVIRVRVCVVVKRWKMAQWIGNVQRKKKNHLLCSCVSVG